MPGCRGSRWTGKGHLLSQSLTCRWQILALPVSVPTESGCGRLGLRPSTLANLARKKRLTETHATAAVRWQRPRCAVRQRLAHRGSCRPTGRYGRPARRLHGRRARLHARGARRASTGPRRWRRRHDDRPGDQAVHGRRICAARAVGACAGAAAGARGTGRWGS